MNDPELDRLLGLVATLRSLGFYASYQEATDSQLWEILRAENDRKYSEMFGRPYQRKLKDYDLLRLAWMDPAKFLFFDVEADVCDGNRVYCWLVESLATLSGGAFRPTEISETWESESGPISVTCRHGDEIVRLNPTYLDDWIDSQILTILIERINAAMTDKIYYVQDDNGPFGQDAALVRLNDDQRARFESVLPWKTGTE